VKRLVEVRQPDLSERLGPPRRPRLPLRALAVACVMSAAVACGGKTPPPGGGTGAVASWEAVRGVLQHPRCQNCHPQDDMPLQGDDSRPHAQNVQRGPEGRGMVGLECVTCHGPGNLPASYGVHVPPGVATGWRMPKPEQRLVFVGRSSAELCAQIKDPARNGGLDAAALRHHLDDPLVAWGWDPGVGRAPIPMARDAFLASWEAWTAAGAPCPAN
jgi:hypothetical protein